MTNIRYGNSSFAFEYDSQAFVEAGGEADLDAYRAVLRSFSHTYHLSVKWHVSCKLFFPTRKIFGEGTAWQEALARRKEAYTPAKRREKR